MISYVDVPPLRLSDIDVNGFEDEVDVVHHMRHFSKTGHGWEFTVFESVVPRLIGSAQA